MNIWIFWAVLAGVCSTLQSAVNGDVSKSAGPGSAVFFNGLVFLIPAGLYLWFMYVRGGEDFARLRDITPMQFLGGFFGFGIVLGLMLCFPKLGALKSVIIMILAQSASAILVDHFGLLGMEKVALTWQRFAAMFMMLAGVFLLRK